MLLMLVSLLVVLGVLIFVHELGHFLVAKAVGIQVLRFSLGFGRPLLAWKRGETEYWVSWIPLGGYVKMAGLEEEGMVGELEGGKADAAIDPERTFDRKPLWARIAVILAGVTMNIILAFVIYTGLGVFSGVAAHATTQVDTVRVEVLPTGAEPLASLRHGDRIMRINGDTIRVWPDVENALLDADSVVTMEVAGRPEPVVFTLPRDRDARERVLRWGIVPLQPARIGLVLPGEPAARAGLRPGDVVVRAGGDTIRSWHDMVLKLWANPARPIDLAVLRGDSLINLTVTPKAEIEEDSTSIRPRTYGFISAESDPPLTKQKLSVPKAVQLAAFQTVRQVGAVVTGLKRLVLGQASMRELGGPIMIAQVSGQAARLGLDRFLMFMAFFSVSLAVLNLLPIPVLDGGHLLFLIVEGIRRKPLSIQLRLRLTQIGMFVVLAIMLIAISNDVLRFFR